MLDERSWKMSEPPTLALFSEKIPERIYASIIDYQEYKYYTNVEG